MLTDAIRTGTYHAAITRNAADFAGATVLDVGAGSGVLSLFAAAAGACRVYAVEASGAAAHAEALAAAQPALASRVSVIRGRVEEVHFPERVDILVSEPMGTLLVNERMLESYIAARDRHLKPGGKMFPGSATIHVALFSDATLHAEVAARGALWQNGNFYGLDLRCLAGKAMSGYFAQPVVDAIPAGVLVSNAAEHGIDFHTVTAAELQDMSIPFALQVSAPCIVHGVATWFDVLFRGTTDTRRLSTAPGMPTTHWYQLRCLLERPLHVTQPGQTVSGELRLTAHARQSYDVELEARVDGADGPSSRGRYDLKDPYYRQSMAACAEMMRCMEKFCRAVLVVLLLTLVLPASASRENGTAEHLPIVLWHGMGDSCCNPQGVGAVMDRIRAALPGVFVHSIATGNTQARDVMSSYFGDANAQVATACDTLRALPELQRGWVGVGFSQGGLLMRALVQRCTRPGDPRPHSLVTMGSPHQGVMDIPGCWQPEQAVSRKLGWSWCEAMQSLLGQGVYYPWLQHSLVQAQYFKDPFHLDWYLDQSALLADINNDRAEKNTTYKAALTALQRLVLFQFDNDITVVPRGSSQFGFNNGTTLVPLRSQTQYKEDWLGLRTLDEAGRLVLERCPGFHMQFTLDWFEDRVVSPLLAVPASEGPGTWGERGAEGGPVTMGAVATA